MGSIVQLIYFKNGGALDATVPYATSCLRSDGTAYDYIFLQLHTPTTGQAMTTSFLASMSNYTRDYSGATAYWTPVCGWAASDTTRALVSSTATTKNELYIIPVTFNYFCPTCTTYAAGLQDYGVYAI